MRTKYYASRFWLSLSLSFYLFIPYLSRYLDEKNRFSFHWTHSDLLALIFCIMAVGSLFFLCFALFYIAGTRLTRKLCEISFISLCGIALMANISHLVKLLKKHPPDSIIILGMLLWILMCGGIVWLLLKNSQRVKTICIMCCFVPSPVLPLFTLSAMGYQSYISDSGSLPTPVAADISTLDDKNNVYLFIFDEWSYLRSFNNGMLIPEFPNLQRLAARAMVFHNAVSPSSNTATAIPSLLFQTNLPFTVRGTLLGFQGKEFHHLNQAENVFHHAQELGFFNAMIGAAMPYGEMLDTSVDFCRSIPVYKRFGNSFFGVAKYHLLTAALMLPAPLFHFERRVIAEYFFNKFQVNCITNTHELFKNVVKNQHRPTFAVFHYMIPHFPYIFTRKGYKNLFAIYSATDTANYYGNLAYLDEKIGEIISILKELNKFEESLIIFTSDHGWRFDPDYDKTTWPCYFDHVQNKWWCYPEKQHVPLFIKMPYQKQSIEINSLFRTYHLGGFINEFLDGKVTLAEVESFFTTNDYFKPDPLEPETIHKEKK